MQTLALSGLLADEETAFIERLRAGDVEAIARAYEDHRGPLCSFARRLLGEEQAAEDLVHDLFVSLPELAHKLHAGRSIRAFLIGVAANRALHYLRQARRRRELAARFSSESPVSVNASEADVERTRLARALAQALDHLSLEHRIAFTLCDIEQRTSPEVAEFLNIPEGTVRTRLFHARKRIRARLEREGVLK